MPGSYHDSFQYQIKAELISTAAVEAALQKIESRWHQPWSEPVRFRRLATAHQQQPYRDPFGPPKIFEGSWHYAWSEPVRQKVGLAARLQTTLAHYPGLPIIPDVYGVLAATETNADTSAIFVMIVDTLPVDLTALYVSVKEVEVSNTSASIKEIE